MFQDMVTVFNRRDGLWYPTVIQGVHVEHSAGAGPAAYGGQRADSVTVLVPYVPVDGAVTVAGKVYLPPKLWQKVEEPERFITFASGEQFDFFVLGPWEETGPVSDEGWPGGFFDHLNRSRDGVFAISSAQRFGALPHFEIVGR